MHRKGLWHRTVHIWIQNSSKELLLQKRSLNKEVYPGYWDVSCAGHLSAGDNSICAAVRELEEELAIVAKEIELSFLFTLPQHYTSPDMLIIENEITDVYLLKRNIEIKDIDIDESELTEVRFVKLYELKSMLNSENNNLADHSREYEMILKCSAISGDYTQ